jgi:hypothetical protein
MPQTSTSHHHRLPTSTTPDLLNFCSRRDGQPLVQFDPVAEAKLRRKIDLMIVPTVALLYLFCFIDRANIGRLSAPDPEPWASKDHGPCKLEVLTAN